MTNEEARELLDKMSPIEEGCAKDPMYDYLIERFTELTRNYKELNERYTIVKNSHAIVSNSFEALSKEYDVLKKDKDKLIELYTNVSDELQSKCDAYQDLKHSLYQQNLLENIRSVDEWDKDTDEELSDSGRVKQEYRPDVIELTRGQVYHLLEFVEDHETVDSVVLIRTHESGIGPIVKFRANVEMDLTDYSTW
jgi:chromosome segregation ATPase